MESTQKKIKKESLIASVWGTKKRSLTNGKIEDGTERKGREKED